MFNFLPDSSGTSLDARKAAELKWQALLDAPEAEQALVFHVLGKAGWTRDSAKVALEQARWWLC